MEENGETNSEEELLPKESEGELAIDAYETPKEFIIQSTIAGVGSNNLDISVEEDMLIIRGRREKPQEIEKENYFQQECFWGPFSKKIILPEKVKIAQAKATVKNGILTLRIPKAGKRTTEKIAIQDK